MRGVWLSCGSYGVYVAVTGSLWLLPSLHPAVFFAKLWLCGSCGTDLHEGVTETSLCVFHSPIYLTTTSWQSYLWKRNKNIWRNVYTMHTWNFGDTTLMPSSHLACDGYTEPVPCPYPPFRVAPARPPCGGRRRLWDFCTDSRAPRPLRFGLARSLTNLEKS